MSKGTKAPHALIAVTRDETDFRAVEIRKHDQTVEVVWTRTATATGRTWSDFAAQCGFSVDAAGKRTGPRSGAAAVVGLDMTAVAFYRIDAPHVGKEETAAIVHMQAESLLPLPPDQIEVAWRTMPSMNGKMDIALAAARRDTLVKFVEQVRDFQPRNILLSCEGTGRAWSAFFGGTETRAVLVSLGGKRTQVCLMLDGLVANTAVVDTGMADLAGAEPGSPASERFIQDMRTAMGSFGWKESDPWPVVVLSDGGEAFDRIAGLLQSVGMTARTCVPATQSVRGPAGFGQRDLYDYRNAIGLALLGLDTSAKGLDLFERIGRAEQQKQAKIARNSMWLAGGLVVVALAAFIATSYAVDVAKFNKWSALVNQAGFEDARQRQVLLRNVARNRPDLLDLLTEINLGENPGIILESFHFKKGSLVTLVGQADNQEQMWKFQKNLIGRKSKVFSAVDLLTTTQDAKTGKIKFTINFHYKTFTKREAAL